MSSHFIIPLSGFTRKTAVRWPLLCLSPPSGHCWNAAPKHICLENSKCICLSFSCFTVLIWYNMITNIGPTVCNCTHEYSDPQLRYIYILLYFDWLKIHSYVQPTSNMWWYSGKLQFISNMWTLHFIRPTWYKIMTHTHRVNSVRLQSWVFRHVQQKVWKLRSKITSKHYDREQASLQLAN